MSILSDHDFLVLQEKETIVTPFKLANLQPASYDVTLSDSFLVYGDQPIDTAEISFVKTRPFLAENIELDPGEFVLGSTMEVIYIPNGFVGRIEGKSSLARIGLVVHVTAGFIDPGFIGNITLEMYNMNKVSITIYEGMKIAQITLSHVSSLSDKPYGHSDLNSKYQGSLGTVKSRYKL